MKKYTKLILVMLSIVIIIISVFIIQKISNIIPKNPQGTIGNTPGNLFNGGGFCEDTYGNVYFANSYDEDTLYSMKSDESNIQKLFSSGVSHINAGDKHLYFYVKNSASSTGLGFVRRVVGVYRCKKNGRDTTTLCRDPASSLSLVNDSLYIQHYDTTTNTTLWKISTDGNQVKTVTKDPINPSSATDPYIYYTDTESSLFLYRLDTATDKSAVYVKHAMWNPICRDGYVYFMDIHNDYRLCRYALDEQIIEVLTPDRIDTYNITESHLYYQTNSSDSPALMRITLDGQGAELVAEGIYTAINVTSSYVYFREFADTGLTYHTSADGPVNVTLFDAASLAADRFRD